jgi:hypothetical protein
MKYSVNKVTARPFLVPRPGSSDDPLFTVIAHIYDTLGEKGTFYFL